MSKRHAASIPMRQDVSSWGSLESGEAGIEAIVEKLVLSRVTLHKHLARIWGAHVFPNVGYTHNDVVRRITLGAPRQSQTSLPTWMGQADG